MKGVGGNYGYPTLTELCAKIEFQIENEDENKIADLINELNCSNGNSSLHTSAINTIPFS